MTATSDNLFLRNDTLFGVCEALGHDFGFPPNLLRIVLGGALIFNPLIAVGTYFALGLVVLASRLIAPDVSAPVALAVHSLPPHDEPANDEAERRALAA